MNTLRLSLWASSLILLVPAIFATGCAVGSDPGSYDGVRQTNGDDTIHSRTFVRIHPGYSDHGDITFVT